MTTEIKSTNPPIPPPRHNKEYYENELPDDLEGQKVVIPPKAPKRMSSRFSSNYDKGSIFKNNEHNIIEKNSSAKSLLESKDFDTNTLENEIMNDLNHLSDHFKLSEDKLTLYEEENERGAESLAAESSVVKSLSSLTINDENNVRGIKIEDIPSDSDSFKSIPNSGKGSPISLERKTVESQPSPLHQLSLPQSPIQQQEIIKTEEEKVESEHEHHKRSKSSKSKSSKSKSKSSKSKEEKKRKEEKRKAKKSTQSEDVNHKEKHKSKSKNKNKNKSEKEKEKEKEDINENENVNENNDNENNELEDKEMIEQAVENEIEKEIEKEIDLLREKEKNQREFVIKEQEKLSELNKQQYLLLQHQYNQALNQKKQYNSLVQSNNLEQMAMLQQQHERENANLQQNQNILAQQVLDQQQTITEAINIYNTIVKNLINYTGESPENYALPTPSQNIQQIPLVVTENDSPNIYLNMHDNNNGSSYSLGTEHSSPDLNSLNSNNILPNQRKVASPTLSPPMSPVVNESYYDEGVYSVSGFSITSNNTSISEDLESVSILTDQLQQSVQRRPTFRKPSSGYNQKIRIGGSDPDTFQTTLNAYRQNVKNASDPALQFEYAKFLIESANDQYENGSTASSVQHKNDLFDEGFKFLKKLSNAGYPDAQHYLATCYNQDGDWDKAYPLFLQAAKHNHPIASYEIASFYESKRNYKKASQYYKKSASQGYPMAMHRLGMAALKGEMHMRKDVKNAIKWLKRAAVVANKDNNGAASAYELSNLYENGMPPVVYPDELYSLELLVQAAELDYPPAQYKLGWCFEYGELGCPTDAVQSIHWFLLAAENNEPNAQFSLAGWYLTGAEGVIEPNDKEAFHWASKAAEQEYVKAEYAIAYFYEMGIGIEKNMEEAMHWYRIAAEHGDERAIKRISTETDRSTEKSSSD